MGALFTTVSSIRVSRVGRVIGVSRVRVTLTVTVRVSRISVMVSVRDKICRSYCDLYFGITFLEHHVYTYMVSPVLLQIRYLCLCF